uniref:Uncharacterized protein n=1 Tax=Glossina austeni TaxID=7395 RepID=A0A1A9UYF7_GLOAU
MYSLEVIYREYLSADYVNSRHFYGVEHEALDLLGKPEFPQTAKRRNTPSAPNCSLALAATVPTVVGDGIGSSLTSWTSSFNFVGSSSTLVLMLEVADIESSDDELEFEVYSEHEINIGALSGDNADNIERNTTMVEIIIIAQLAPDPKQTFYLTQACQFPQRIAFAAATTCSRIDSGGPTRD